MDGKLSADCYLRAVDRCYAAYSEKFEKQVCYFFYIFNYKHYIFYSFPLCFLFLLVYCYFYLQVGKKMAVDAIDYVVFHAPYNKLVQKSLARLVLFIFLSI